MAEKNSIHFIYYFASSSDGFIADASGSVEWLNAFHGGVDYGANDFQEFRPTAIASMATGFIGAALVLSCLGSGAGNPGYSR